MQGQINLLDEIIVDNFDGGERMKAYIATDEWNGVSLVVFAETRAKAKEILLHTDEFDMFQNRKILEVR